MDKIFKLQDLEFEWDEEKYAINLRKHSVKFEEAAEVFFDPENRFGDASVEDEFREYVVGYSLSNRILLVVFVERVVRTRIISARRATDEESKNMKKDKKEVVTEEGFALKFYPRETKTIALELSADTVDVLEKKAKQRDMPLEALLKFYIGQGLRQDLSQEEAKELALKRLRSRKGSEEKPEVDLAV